jgi:hypothetical protein
MFKRIANFFKPTSLFDVTRPVKDGEVLREFYQGIVTRGMQIEWLLRDGVAQPDGNYLYRYQLYSPLGRMLGLERESGWNTVFLRRARTVLSELLVVPGEMDDARKGFVELVQEEIDAMEREEVDRLAREQEAEQQRAVAFRHSPVSVTELTETLEVKTTTGTRFLLGAQYHDLREPLRETLLVWFAYQQAAGLTTLPYHTWGERILARHEEEFSVETLWNNLYVLDGDHSALFDNFSRMFDTVARPNRLVEMYCMLREAICASREPIVLQVLTRHAVKLEAVNELIQAHAPYYSVLPKLTHLNDVVETPYGRLGIIPSPELAATEGTALRNLRGLYNSSFPASTVSTPRRRARPSTTGSR